MKRFFKNLNQRGDTLVEVTIALTIMSVVLTSAFVLAEKSNQLSTYSKERSLLIAAAQQQAEALTSYRDRYGWTIFSTQVANAQTGATCSSGFQCFTIDPNNTTANPLTTGEGPVDGVPTSKISISVVATPSVNLKTFQVSYEAEPAGGGPKMSSEILLQLGNTDSLLNTVRP